MENTPVVIIDCGSCNVRTIVAEQRDDGGIAIIGVGTSTSSGIRSGKVQNIGQATESIRTSVAEAAQMSNHQIGSAYVGISGDCIQTCNSSGLVAISHSAAGGLSTVTEDDKERVLTAAKSRLSFKDQQILEVIPQQFSVDGQDKVPEPTGLNGTRLEVDVHIVTVTRNEAQNLIAGMNNAQIHVNRLFYGLSAAGLAVLSEEDKELGVVLVDFGWSKTDIGVYVGGALRHTASIALGGHNITFDVARVLSVLVRQAEYLKREYGAVYPPRDPSPVILNLDGSQIRSINPDMLNTTIFARQKEIFDKVGQEIEKSKLWHSVGGGLVLTGGGAELRGIAELAEECFNKKARVGNPRELGGLTDKVSSPSYATVVGLLIAVFNQMGQKIQNAAPIREGLGTILKSWWNKNNPMSDFQPY